MREPQIQKYNEILRQAVDSLGDMDSVAHEAGHHKTRRANEAHIQKRKQLIGPETATSLREGLEEMISEHRSRFAERLVTENSEAPIDRVKIEDESADDSLKQHNRSRDDRPGLAR